jgi:hypothetical protein
MAAMAGASGARTWLQAQHATWLTERRLRIATVGVFSAAVLGSSFALSGSSPAAPAHAHQPLPAHHAATR